MPIPRRSIILTRSWCCFTSCRSRRNVSAKASAAVALGVSLTASSGISAPEVNDAYVQAQALAAQVGDDTGRFVALAGLDVSEFSRADTGGL